MTTRLMAIAAAISAISVLAARPAPVDACSCGRPAMQREMIPRSGANNVPTGARIRVFLTNGFAPPLRRHLGREYRLRDARGKRIRITTRVIGRRLDLIPTAPLRPRHRYRVEQLLAFDDAGDRLSDDERWAIATGRPGVARVAWFPVADFETGAGRDRRKPPTAAVSTAQLHFAFGGGDCGPAVSLSVKHATALDPTDVIELEVDGAGVVDSFPASTSLFAGDSLCNPDPVRLAADTRRVRLKTRTLSGAVATGPWVETTGKPARPLAGRRSIPTSPGGRDPAVAAWARAEVLASARADKAGPKGCEHGFVADKSATVAASGGPWTYENLAAVGWASGAGWLAVDGPKEDTVLFRFDANLKAGAPTALPGGTPALAATTGGVFVASRRYHSAEPRFETVTHVARLDAAGSTRWRRAFGPVSSDGEPRIVAGGGRVLVASSRSDVHRTGKLTQRLCWVVLDARTGRDLTSSGEACRPTTGDSYVGLARLGKGFALAYHVPGVNAFRTTGLELLMIPDRGKPRSQKIALDKTDHGVDLAAAGNRVGLVTERGGHIVWALIDGRGKVTTGPVEISRGVGAGNRKPRIAFDGTHFAITWERRTAARAYAAAVDPGGAVSPALELAGGSGASTAGISAGPPGFFVAASTREDPKHPVLVETLRCGKSLKPPQKIRKTW
jgi:hypothetical protein